MLKGAPASAKQMDDRELSSRHRFCDSRLAVLHRVGRAAGYLIGQQFENAERPPSGDLFVYGFTFWNLPKSLARWRPIFPSYVKPLCVAVGLHTAIVSTGSVDRSMRHDDVTRNYSRPCFHRS